VAAEVMGDADREKVAEKKDIEVLGMAFVPPPSYIY
jgi:hypothetical protein